MRIKKSCLLFAYTFKGIQDSVFFLQMGSFCLCDIGFTGPFCETPIECIHGSITVENLCSCIPNWAGEDCNQCAYGKFHNYRSLTELVRT